jgi:hypothetical protein
MADIFYNSLKPHYYEKDTYIIFVSSFVGAHILC